MNDGRKKVLFICSWYPNELNQTIGNFVRRHAEAAQLLNDVVTLNVVSSSTEKTFRINHKVYNNVNEVTVYYPKNKSSIHIISKFYNFRSQKKAFNLGFNQANSILKKIEIVHLNVSYPLGIWALWLKLTKKIPYVITEHSTQYDKNSDLNYSKINLIFNKLILKHSSFILPVSTDLGDKLNSLCSTVPYSVVSNVADESLFKIKDSNRHNDPKRFVHISTVLDSQKNVSGILRVINELLKIRTDFHLDIVSDGNFDYLISQVQHYGINEVVHFHSTKTTIEIAEIIQQSDALLLFSNYENFPCVIAEAMMCGVPTISTKVNGIPEHINPSTGILVEKGDENELKNVLLAFLDGKNNFDKEQIRDYALRNFSYQTVSQKFNLVYNDVLNNSN